MPCRGAGLGSRPAAIPAGPANQFQAPGLTAARALPSLLRCRGLVAKVVESVPGDPEVRYHPLVVVREVVLGEHAQSGRVAGD